MTLFNLDELLSHYWPSPLFPVYFCFFLTCIQVSQEMDKVVWYFNLFNSFSQFVVIYTVKAFSIVKETEVDFFLEFPWFSYEPTYVANLISSSSALSKPSSYILKFSVHVLLEPSLKDFEHNGKWVQLYHSLKILWHCPSLELEWKLTFSSPEATTEFSKLTDLLSTAL